MSNLIQTKERLNSTKSTQKVIKAMELVASSKIKQAKERAEANNAYYEGVKQVANTVFSAEDVREFLKTPNPNKPKLIIAITSDMGLCGSYNINVLNEVNRLYTKGDQIVMVGNKGINKLTYEQIPLLEKFQDASKMDPYKLSSNLASLILDSYKGQEYSKILIVYTFFKNPLFQDVQIMDVFDSFAQTHEQKNNNLLIEGDKEEMFNQVLNQYVHSSVYHAVLNSIASEYAARRNSMDAANKNSLELIDQLNLKINTIRQAMITQEITEIIGGAQALSGEE